MREAGLGIYYHKGVIVMSILLYPTWHTIEVIAIIGLSLFALGVGIYMVYRVKDELKKKR
jgi:hypothetical protein